MKTIRRCLCLVQLVVRVPFFLKLFKKEISPAVLDDITTCSNEALRTLAQCLKAKGITCTLENYDICVVLPGPVLTEDSKYLLKGYSTKGGWSSEPATRVSLTVNMLKPKLDAWG